MFNMLNTMLISLDNSKVLRYYARMEETHMDGDRTHKAICWAFVIFGIALAIPTGGVSLVFVPMCWPR